MLSLKKTGKLGIKASFLRCSTAIFGKVIFILLLNLDKPKTVFVATFTAEISRLEGIRSFAIVMNAESFEEATDIDYFITNVDPSIVTSQWVVETYSQRNWVEVFYREACMMVRFKRIPSAR